MSSRRVILSLILMVGPRHRPAQRDPAIVWSTDAVLPVLRAPR